MKQLFFCGFAMVLFSFGAVAQERAVTEEGEEVVLYRDGTWKYVNDEDKPKKIKTNAKKFEKAATSSFLVKCSKVNFGIYINPKDWTFTKGEGGAEYDFVKKGDDIYGMLITETLEIPLESLKDIAIENARSAAPDLRVVEEEYRMVNGIKVLMMKMVGTIQGIEFAYLGYYYSNSSGSCQFITYSGVSILEQNKEQCELLLNGFVELNK